MKTAPGGSLSGAPIATGVTMPRALWKGTLAFGLVSIPVELHNAVRDARPKFRLLHAKDKSPISYERVCRKEGKAVAWDELVKGYEYQKGHFITLTKEDFETAALEKSRVIDVLDFVAEAEIDPRFFDVPYYIVPAKGSDRAYAVLRAALADAGKVGIGRVMLREVQHLAGIAVVEDAIVLTLMRFADELIDEGTLSFPKKTEIRPKELQLAKSLVDSMTSEWDPANYKDEYTDNLMKVLKAKMKGKAAKLEAAEPRQSAEVIDLMTRLRESLAQSKGGKTTSVRRAPSRKTTSAKKRARSAA
jgi:DNA end-binding protein Ku